MKGDFTRDTYNSEKHYQQVLMQQGRVQLDADWNEQSAIAARRDETTTADLVGDCGGPADNAAFAIITDNNVLDALPADPNAPIRQFALSAGRYYVDGLQCQADSPFLFSWQPDHRETSALPDGNYLVYLDVWRRHLTMHEDGDIREAALGGPDTATRIKTVWQVRAAALGEDFDPENSQLDPCLQLAEDFDARQRSVLPRLAAKTTDATPDTDPCIVPQGAGYRGLENQLYRVEIHAGGAVGVATYKWSRENGAVVTRITNNVVVPIDGVDVNRLTVVNTGLDDNLAFKKGTLVEVIHEKEELEGEPGTLALVDEVDDGAETITLAKFGANPMPLTIDMDSNPRLRRWEGFGDVEIDLAVNNGFLALEDGVEFRFDQPAGALFLTGDYWQIPARTASPDAQSGKIEWPGGADPEFLPPKGIAHHYCRLGVISVIEGALEQISDCRCLWPALTDVPRLFYISGDGQEVMPDPRTAPTGALFKLPRPLIVGVPNAHCHDDLRTVRFEVVNTPTSMSNGQVVAAGNSPTQNFAEVPLDNDGLAKCDFHLDGLNYSQQVEARMLNKLNQPVSTPIRFNATLSRATEVSYDPDQCDGLADQVTVQDAIDRLAGQVSLYKVSGDAQTGAAGQTLPQEIVVQVANRCGPVAGIHVQFIVRAGGGSVSPTQAVTTDSQGRALCKWRLGNSTTTQELEATIVGDTRPTAAPASIRFTAHLPSAESEPGLRIKAVSSRRASGEVPLELGMILSLNQLRHGLRIDCDGEVDPATVTDGGSVVNGNVERREPTCFVTVEVPLPLTNDEIDLWGDDGLVGYAPVVLAADVQAESNQIFWRLSRHAFAGLRRVLSRIENEHQGRMGDRVLARLTLKGNFIWARSGDDNQQPVYLDGETYRVPQGFSPNLVQLPSGDNRRGGDFEMWFWISTSAN